MSHPQAYIGIFALARRQGASARYGEQAPFYAKLMRVGLARGAAVYLFGPADIDWRNRQVWGRTYSPQRGGWVRRPYPLPQAVYNRYPAAAYTSLVTSTIARLKANGSPFINSPFLDKYHLHQRLLRLPGLQQHLPETLPCQGSAAAPLQLLHRHAAIYLKPVDGSLGSGVVRVRRLSGSRYHVAGRIGGRRLAREVGPAGLAPVLRRIVSSRRYLVQQGLDLGVVPGRAADIRALVQRDERGSWQLTGMALRVGAGGSVTSNLHGGGHAVHVEQALRSFFGPARTPPIMAEVRRVLGLFVAGLETTLGPMGELGMDLGVDVKGHVWYIESNPKPGRAILAHLHATRARALSISRPVDYAICLARRGHNRSLPPPNFELAETAIPPLLLDQPEAAPVETDAAQDQQEPRQQQQEASR